MFLSIERVNPGMKVVRDVMNANGAVLLPAGASLSAELLERLKTWGIKGLHVEGDEPSGTSPEAPQECPPEFLRAAEELIDRRLRHITENSATVTRLREMAIRRIAQRLMREAQERPPGKAD